MATTTTTTTTTTVRVSLVKHVGDNYYTTGEVVLQVDAEVLHSLQSFDKAAILRALGTIKQGAIKLEQWAKEEGLVPTCTLCYQDPFCKPVSRGNSIEQLKKVDIRELEKGKWHQGCILRGRLVAAAFSLAKVGVTLLEDEAGVGVGVLLLLQNALRTDSSQEELARLLPVGAEVVVRDPCLVQDFVLQGVALWVSNPAALEIVSHFNPGFFHSFKSADELRSRGNQEFSKRNYFAAIELYTKAMSYPSEEGVLSGSSAVALSNRAEAWLQLGYCERALKDATKSLKLDSANVKSISRKIRAYFGLRQYVEALRFLNAATHNLTPEGGSSLEQLRRDCLRFEKESVNGDYDLSAFILHCLEKEKPPAVEFAEYIGPVKIHMTCDGSGRGVFLTAAVNKGTLLSVSKVVAAVPFNEQVLEHDGTDLVAAVVRACIASPRILQQVYSMPEGVPGQKLVTVQKDVPTMNLLRPNSSSSSGSSSNDIDVVKIFNVIHKSMETATRCPYVAAEIAGLWTLPAFINHSCLPNVTVTKFRDYIFVFAAKDMNAGTELVRSYYEGNILRPMLQQKRCGCKCPRCSFEARMGESLQKVSQRAAVLAEHCKRQGLQGWAESCDREAVEIAVDVEALAKQNKLGKEEEQWLRASFAAAYIIYSRMERQGKVKAVPGMPSEVMILQACHETAPHAQDTLAMILRTMQDRGVRNREAGLDLLDEQLLSLYGQQTTEVMQAIVYDFQRKRMYRADGHGDSGFVSYKGHVKKNPGFP